MITETSRLHIELDISTVADHVNLGGIDQPIIGNARPLSTFVCTKDR